MDMANGKKETKKASKRINVEIAPGVYRLLKAKRDEVNAAPDRAEPPQSYADMLNRALDSYLPPLPATETGAAEKE
jgi:hypothetical protein